MNENRDNLCWKTGTTEYCAGILSKALDASLINLEADNGNLNDYDIIIIGSSIRMGMVHPKIKRFLKIQKFNSRKILRSLFAKGYLKHY